MNIRKLGQQSVAQDNKYLSEKGTDVKNMYKCCCVFVSS